MHRFVTRYVIVYYYSIYFSENTIYLEIEQIFAENLVKKYELKKLMIYLKKCCQWHSSSSQ